GRKLLAEVESLLLVRPARCQLVSNPEIAAPRPAAECHPDPQLRLDVLIEERPAQPAEARLERVIDSVPHDIEEAALAARGGRPLANAPRPGARGDGVPDVEDRDLIEAPAARHDNIPALRFRRCAGRERPPRVSYPGPPLYHFRSWTQPWWIWSL